METASEVKTPNSGSMSPSVTISLVGQNGIGKSYLANRFFLCWQIPSHQATCLNVFFFVGCCSLRVCACDYCNVVVERLREGKGDGEVSVTLYGKDVTVKFVVIDGERCVVAHCPPKCVRVCVCVCVCAQTKPAIGCYCC